MHVRMLPAVWESVCAYTCSCKLVRRDLRRARPRALRRGSVLGGGWNQSAERLPCSRRGARHSDLSNKLVLVFLVWLLGKENQTPWRSGFCRARPSPLPQPRALTCGRAGGPARPGPAQRASLPVFRGPSLLPALVSQLLRPAAQVQCVKQESRRCVLQENHSFGK